jgi:probable HAF family extracellular repeat protein
MFGHRMFRLARVLFLTLVALAPLNALPAVASEGNASALPVYEITDLGTLGGTWSFATGLNDNGQVVGAATLPGDTVQHAFLWQNGSMTDLGALGGSNSYAVGIDKSGVVTGGAETSDPNGDDFCGTPGGIFPAVCHAYVWQNGVMTDLGSPLGGLNTGSNGIDDRGQVSGQAELAASDPNFGTPQAHGFLWQHGVMQDLGAIGGPLSWGAGINNRTQLTGGSTLSFNLDPATGYYDIHAVVFDHGAIRDLGTLGGSTSDGNAINNRGDVTGLSYLANNTDAVPFIWHNGQLTAIDLVAGDSDGEGIGIADSGQVVGASGPLGAPVHAFSWSHGVTTDLNTRILANSGWQLTWAFAINARGQIVGQGIVNGQYHAFLLTPSSANEAGVALGASVPAASVLAHAPAATKSENRLLKWWQSGFGLKRVR